MVRLPEQICCSVGNIFPCRRSATRRSLLQCAPPRQNDSCSFGRSANFNADFQARMLKPCVSSFGVAFKASGHTETDGEDRENSGGSPHGNADSFLGAPVLIPVMLNIKPVREKLSAFSVTGHDWEERLRPVARICSLRAVELGLVNVACSLAATASSAAQKSRNIPTRHANREPRVTHETTVASMPPRYVQSSFSRDGPRTPRAQHTGLAIASQISGTHARPGPGFLRHGSRGPFGALTGWCTRTCLPLWVSKPRGPGEVGSNEEDRGCGSVLHDWLVRCEVGA